jgi:DNA-binding winged helix-turn-helix (wHTH) protein/tetratricopeptide (TPR) repeat protein/TolB-like protein
MDMSSELESNKHQNNLAAANLSDHKVYEFAGFRLDVAHLMLYRGTDEVALTPKQVETLLVLVENHGEIVSKDDMMKRLWGETAVEESNLIQNIYVLRKELGDTAEGKPMIETLRRRGYRFMAPLSSPINRKAPAAANPLVLVDTSVIATADKAAGSEGALPWYQHRPVGLTAGAIVLLGLIFIGASFLLSSSTSSAGNNKQFAVLPLKPIDTSNRSEMYEIGVAESLINRLNSIQGFVARPLSAVRAYDALDQDAVVAGREQKVDHVIAANYQLADGRIRISAELINVETGSVDDTFRIETAAGSIFAVHDVVADEVARRLIIRFDRGTAASRPKRGTNNEEAYRAYMQGRGLSMIRTPAAAKRSVEYFEEAIKLDPNYALPHARMAQMVNALGSGEQSGAERARQLITKALELDPNLAEAYVSRGNLYMMQDWNFGAAEKDLLRAIELEPNNDTAHWLYGLLLTHRGRTQDGLREIETARSIDPGAVVYMFHRGRALYYARREQEAITQYNEAMAIDDRFMQPYGWLVRLYENRGDYETAFGYFLQREQRSPRSDRIDSYRRSYETEGWLGVRRNAADAPQPQFFDLARLHSIRGEKDMAVEYLQKAVEKREWLVTTLPVEPAFDSLRDDPRFAEIVKRVGYSEE